jgi:polyferredoxin
LLFALGICFLLSGPFVEDVTGTPFSGSSVHGILHGIFGGIVFVVMPLSCFVFLRRFREDPNWRWFKVWTLVLGIIISFGVFMMIVSIKIPTTAVYFTNWNGLIQRIALVPWMIWLFVFALGMLKRVSK